MRERAYPFDRKRAGTKIDARSVTRVLEDYGPLRAQQIAYYLGVSSQSVNVPLLRLWRLGVVARRNETPQEQRERTSLLGAKRKAPDARWKCAKYAFVYELPAVASLPERAVA